MNKTNHRSTYDYFSSAYQEDLKDFVTKLTPSGSKRKTVVYKGQELRGTYDYIFLANSFAYIPDVQHFIKTLKKHSHKKTRVVVIYFNFLWRPILSTATLLGLRQKDQREPNWLSPQDISNLFYLENFDEVISGKRLLLPLKLGLFSTIVNRFFAQLPLINHFCLTTYQIFRPIPPSKEYSVSIIIPARNEEGHIKGVLKKIPKLGSKTEVIFVEGNSTDDTYEAINDEIKRNKRKAIKARLFKQKGKGKADATRLGFAHAKNDMLMILDADLTVPPGDLTKFYRLISEGKGEFANGSRLMYPMEDQAMRTLNYLGNKLFSLAFTYLLNQRVKDTLCGTKAILREDYLRIKRNNPFGDFDPFGDFELLFGATLLNMKIVDIPIRYKERTYGTTNISRFTHGWLLIQMTFFAARKIKFK